MPFRKEVIAALIACMLAADARADAATDQMLHGVMERISVREIEDTIRTLAAFGTRHSLSARNDPRRGIGAARRYVQSQLEKCSLTNGRRLRVSVQEFVAPAGPYVSAPTPMTNVVATLDGADRLARSRVYVLDAHYDSRASRLADSASDAPGANDDASGIAVIVAAACALAPEHFDATLVFLATAGEEQGMLGASHWVAEARKGRIEIAGMIANDIVGGAHEVGERPRRAVRVFAEGVPDVPDRETRAMLLAGGENDRAPRQLARFIQDIGARFVPRLPVHVIYRRDRYLRGGDHVPFLDAGYAAVRVTEAVESFKHQHQNVRVEDGVQYGDLPEFVDFEYVADVARLNAVALAALALGPAAPRGVTLDNRKLGNDTTLSWRANEEPDIAGYRILWRETTSAFWQQQADVGLVTRHTLKGLSRDDWIFGVQAVDSAGNASAATFPLPAR